MLLSKVHGNVFVAVVSQDRTDLSVDYAEVVAVRKSPRLAINLCVLSHILLLF